MSLSLQANLFSHPPRMALRAGIRVYSGSSGMVPALTEHVGLAEQSFSWIQDFTVYETLAYSFPYYKPVR